MLLAAAVVVLAFAAATLRGRPAGEPAFGAAASEARPPASAANEDREPAALQAVVDGERAARRYLADRYGMTCIMSSDITLYVPPDAGRKLDERMAAAGITRGWVIDGQNWAGTAEEAAVAFGAEAAFADEQRVWIIRRDPNPRASELWAITTPLGRTVWGPLNEIMACDLDDPAASFR